MASHLLPSPTNFIPGHTLGTATAGVEPIRTSRLPIRSHKANKPQRIVFISPKGKMEGSDGNFDAVAMKRRAARRIYKQLASVDETGRLSYWQKRTEALRKRQSNQGGVG